MQSSRGASHFVVRAPIEDIGDSIKIQGVEEHSILEGVGAITTRLNVWKLGYNPIKIHNLKPLLQNYSNKAIGTELLQGFQFGFRIGYKGPRLGGKSKNIKIFFAISRSSKGKNK